MASESVNGGTPFSGKLRVEGIQSVVPTKPTDPRQSSRIIVSSASSAAAVMRRRFHVLLCYNKASSDESGWVVAGQMRESLARALQEQPLLAGRLRRREDEELEIVSNDSGGRLVEAAAEMELGDFVGMKEEKKREAEAELAFWEDVLHHTPQFSPLFYVQVTNFTCGGYSIGISCSLLLSDPFALTNTIKKWAIDHKTIVSRTEIPKMPTFYLPSHGKPASSPSLLMGPNTNKHSAESLIFNIPTTMKKNMHKNLAALCVEEAEVEASRELASNLSLLVKAPLEDVRIEECSRTGLLECPKSDYDKNGMSCARTWDELELEKICFSGGNKPIYASSWVNSVADEGCVMIVPSTHSGVKIVVSFA